MKKLLLLPFFLIVINAQAQDVWTEYSTAQVSNTGVRSISIVDANVAWLNLACGTTGCSTITSYARTVNGGSAWTTAAINLGPSSADLTIANIAGVSASVAYASVYPSVGAALGGIWKTTDAGVSWTRQATAVFSDPSSFTDLVNFWSANDGIALGDPTNGYFEIYKTLDGGTNWTRIGSTAALIPIDPLEYVIENNFSVSGDNIWAGTTFGRILHSNDRGVTWSVIQGPIADFGGGINSSQAGYMAFTDSNNGLLQTSNYLLYSTADAGATWTAVPWTGILRDFGISAIPGTPNAYVSIGEDLGSTERGTSFSTDGGYTWFNINNNPDLNFVQGGIIAMLDENVGFASGFSSSPTVGGIYRWNGGPMLHYGNIKLNAFIDTNGNNIQDGAEVNYSGGTFSYQLNSQTPHFINSYNGHYYMTESNPANIYNFAYNSDNNCQLTSTVPSYSNVSIPLNSGTTVYNFPLVPVNLNCSDLSVHIYGGCPRPSTTDHNLVSFKNSGSQTIASGIITFTKDSNVTISSVYPSASSVYTATPVVIPTGFTCAFTNLLPNEERILDVFMLIPALPTVSIGQLISNSVSIAPTDPFPYNNTAVLSQNISASWDPNDITESHGGKILYSSFSNNDYLTYTIRFENTGTAAAMDINVNDLLDSKLDGTSIRMIDASHAYTLDRVGANLTWNFANIVLPPSVANTTIGKGYIVFEIKPKAGYAVGDIIPNAARIYFDTNPAIVTNTFDTEFVATLAVNQFTDADFTVYPNPTSGLINISSKKTALFIESISLVDVLGKVIMYKKVNLSNTSTDISELSKGLYFLKIKSEGMVKTVKIVKE